MQAYYFFSAGPVSNLFRTFTEAEQAQCVARRAGKFPTLVSLVLDGQVVPLTEYGRCCAGVAAELSAALAR